MPGPSQDSAGGAEVSPVHCQASRSSTCSQPLGRAAAASLGLPSGVPMISLLPQSPLESFRAGSWLQSSPSPNKGSKQACGDPRRGMHLVMGTPGTKVLSVHLQPSSSPAPLPRGRTLVLLPREEAGPWARNGGASRSWRSQDHPPNTELGWGEGRKRARPRG